jgi:homoserine dehydrogenase
LGLGTVGTGVVEILQRPPHPLLQAVEIAAVGVRSLDKPRPVSIPPERLTTDLERIVSDPEIDVVIELMGGLEPARSLILKAIDHGKPVITANKAGLVVGLLTAGLLKARSVPPSGWCRVVYSIGD